jgi:serine/threonine-protein kinase HipA
VERFAGIVFNEACCMRLAAAVGLPVAKTEIRHVEDVEYLLIERYDRTYRQNPEGTPVLKRLHQEDFCQALGIVSENKYQKEGGPSLKQCFALLREVSSAPVLDLAHLLDAVIFNFLIGNNDAHGKNFSLLYRGVGTTSMEARFAPLYDVVSTRYYPELTRELAMKIGGEYSSDKVSKANFEQLAEDAGLAKPLVRRRIPELAEAVLSNLDKTGIGHPAIEALTGQIRERCETIQRALQ